MADDDKRAEVGSYYVDQFARAMNAVGEQFYAHRDQLLFEIERLRIENIQLKFACGYPMPADDERHILPTNPFKCGICDARRNSK